MPADALSSGRLVDHFEAGLDAPICLTWELTYACNLACIHCLSSSGRRDPRELTTAECFGVIDELQAMQVFYVNIGGGEPTVRRDFWEILDYATTHDVGVKFSTNGSRITAENAARLAASDYVDVQISLDGASASVNDAIRGPGSFATATEALERLAEAGMRSFKISVVVTRTNVDQLDEFEALADRFGAQLRLTRLRPSGRGADVWEELHPTASQQRQLYDWLLPRGDKVLTGDSFFHLAAYGQPLPGLNLCGAGRVVCLIDPIGDVYACPFAIHEAFRAGNMRATGGFTAIWRTSELFQDLRATPDRRRVRVVLALRHVPRRVHGGEVLHGPAARRSGPGVRARERRVAALEAARSGRAAADGGSFAPAAPASDLALRALSPGRFRGRVSDGGRLVRIDCGSAAAGEAAAPEVGLHGDLGRNRARADLEGQHRGVRRARVRAARRRSAERARPVDDGDGADDRASGGHLAHGSAGGPPRRGGRRRASRGGPRHGDGAELVREQARGGGRRGEPADVLPGLLGGFARGDPRPRRASTGGGSRRTHRHLGLDLLPRARLGKPVHPRAARSQDDGAHVPRGADPSALVLSLGADRTAPRHDRPEHGRRGWCGAELLRRLRAVDADEVAELGRRAVAARAVGWSVHAQGSDARRRREAGVRHRRERDLGLEPRREQPGRDARDHPCAAGDRRSRGRRDRGAARRRHPARQRRGEGRLLSAPAR